MIFGINNLSTAKNLALAGVKSVTLHDAGNVEMWDLSGNFFLSEDDIGKNRAVTCVSKLQELNNAVSISALTEELTTEHLSKFQVR
jgi:ubiquitin-activating enzyme E1